MLNRKNVYEPVSDTNNETHDISDVEDKQASSSKTGEPNTAQVSCCSMLGQLKGKLMILIAGTLSVAILSTAKHFAHLPVGQFTATLFALAEFFIISAYFFMERSVDYKGRVKFVLLRAAFGGVGGLLKIWAAREMNVGDCIAIYSLMPVFAALFSRVLWKEKISIFTIIALFLGLAGVCLIAKPPFIFEGSKEKESHPLHSLIPLFAALINGFAFSCMRRVGTSVSSFLVSSNLAAFIVLDSIIFHFAMEDELVMPDCFVDRTAITLAAIGYVLALFLVNKGLALEKSGPGVLMKNFDVVTAYVIQIVFFKSLPDVLSIVGALLILSSAILVSVSKLFFEKMFAIREF